MKLERLEELNKISARNVIVNEVINSHLEGINDYLFNKDKLEFIVVGYEGKDNLKHDKLIKSLFGKNAIHL